MATKQAIKLSWLGEAPAMPVGTTWGIPWREGELLRGDPLYLQHAGSGAAVPMQSWPAAYWPDGSVKWSAHAAMVGGGNAAADGYVVRAGSSGAGTAGDRSYAVRAVENAQSASATAASFASEAAPPTEAASSTKAAPTNDSSISVKRSENIIVIDTGVIQCVIGLSGSRIIQSITREGEQIVSSGRLVCLKQAIQTLTGERVLREERFEGVIRTAVIEQDGPLRAVIKLEGSHRYVKGKQEWLPFTLRLYLYAGSDCIQMVHTFHYDGNPHEDYIQGLGLTFTVPMRGPLYNRHVRYAGDSGFFAESPKTLHTRRTKGRYRDWFEAQQRGELLTSEVAADSYFSGLLEDSAVWNDFKLMQLSSEHYAIQKRTQEGCCWIKAAEGRRAGGLSYAGSECGGLAVGLSNFWRKYPSGLEAAGLAGDEAKLTVWLWSPEAQPMDLRHYDVRTHVESSYEGAEELRATPYGIANTSELLLWCLSGTPRQAGLSAMVKELDLPSRLVCEPAYYYEAGAFGTWSLPDRSHPVKAYLEDQLEGIIEFYKSEVEQRKWYGLWDYGDFMHSYDSVRHVWNYDLGGCAWQNTELAPNMWLWIMFLRSGREDIFRLAEAMTRHTSEVDVYHFGEYEGLGSRHNVVHWGCGCKEARIAMAGLHRYYYYLTGDERTGDLIDAVKDADYATVQLDPMRAYFAKDEHPTHIRIGPDWAAFSSNWMTRWERFEDESYLHKIQTGIACVKAAKYQLISGPTYGYDPATSKLTPLGDDNWGRHLMICMGAPQVWMELSGMLKDAEWDKMMADFGVYYNMPQEEKDLITNGEISHSHFEHPVLSTAIAAYGAGYYRNESAARQVWDILMSNNFARVQLMHDAVDVTYVDALKEIDWINTNEASQWSLNTIISLAWIADWLPQDLK